MPESVNKAVFLSYASQDVEAARRVCETLRAAGMDVWLDADGGLEQGGEAMHLVQERALRQLPRHQGRALAE